MALSESRNIRMREIALMDVQLAELGAAMQRGHALAGVEQRVRIEGRLDREEALELAGTELDAHPGQLFDTDAVLAGDRASNFDAKLEDRRAECLGARDLAFRVRVVEDERMQVAVAGVEHVGAAQSELHRQLFDSCQYRRQRLARNRPVHAVVIRRDAANRRKRGLASRPEKEPLRLVLRYADFGRPG